MDHQSLFQVWVMLALLAPLCIVAGALSEWTLGRHGRADRGLGLWIELPIFILRSNMALLRLVCASLVGRGEKRLRAYAWVIAVGRENPREVVHRVAMRARWTA